jgi:hypothetical protein
MRRSRTRLACKVFGHSPILFYFPLSLLFSWLSLLIYSIWIATTRWCYINSSKWEPASDSDEEEQFTILACLLQVLADELKSAAPKHGHSKFGRKNRRQDRGWTVTSCYTPTISLMIEHIPQKNFCWRCRMIKEWFITVVHGVRVRWLLTLQRNGCFLIISEMHWCNNDACILSSCRFKRWVPTHGWVHIHWINV